MIRKQMLPLLLCGCVLAGSWPEKLAAQAWTPGQSYFNSNNYAEYIYGTLPVIISAPHGGSLTPAAIPNRTDIACGGDATTVKDVNTLEIARALDLALSNLFGAHPHTIINRLHRIKLDMNRPQDEAACGSAIAGQTWLDYHAFIDSARRKILQQYGRGLFIDLHGHGHSIQRNEIGYLLTGYSLRQSDNSLNSPASVGNSSIRYLAGNNVGGLSHAALLRGPRAFGTLLANAGYPSVPSQQDPAPAANEDYFNGGYNTARWGSRDSGVIDAFQIEMNYTGVRDNNNSINAFAAALAQAIKTYLGEMLDSTTRLSAVPFTTGNLLVGRFATGTTTIQKISLGEIDPGSGTLVQTVNLPASGAQSIGLTNIVTDGQLSLSGNGQYLTLTGYALEEGAASSITASATGRSVAKIDATTSYQSYVLPNSSEGLGDKDPFNASNIRSAYSPDGNGFYVCGGATGSYTATTGGIWYFTAGNQNNPVQIIPTPNTRYMQVADGQLYAAAQNITGSTTLPQGFYRIGNGLPVTAADSTRLFTPNATTVIGFCLSPDGTVAYVCINGSTTHVEKWSKTGSTWSFLYNVRPAGVTTAPRGIAVRFGSGTAAIFLTYGTQVVRVEDLVASTVAPAADPAATVVYTETAAGIGLRGLSFTPGSPVLLPLRLVSFTGALLQSGVRLQWQWNDPEELRRLVIEKSRDGKNFVSIGQVSRQATGFTDIEPGKGQNYYRLRSTDRDGKITYSKHLLLQAAPAARTGIYPNPARDYITVHHGLAGRKAVISIFGTDGKRLQTVAVAEGALSTTLAIQELSGGVYTVQYRSPEQTSNFKLIK